VSAGLILAARIGLSFLWLLTGVTSAFFAKDVGYDVLANAEITGSLAELCIISGSVLDVAIGVWLLTGWRLKACYLTQISVIAVYTLLLTFIDASFWLHPFGPLSKNIPLLVLIYVLYSQGSLPES
jgi:hypothetical protein